MIRATQYAKNDEVAKMKGKQINFESYTPIYTEKQRREIKREVETQLYNVFKKYV